MARTYKRDSRGRFAGGGGSSAKSSRPPARPVSKGPNRLTRDNAGRITSVGGNGATARGGRLRTAAGNQRATQTARISSKRTGRLIKPQSGVNVQPGKATAASTALRRGEFVRANLRPRNVMAKPVKGENPFTRGANQTQDDRSARLANVKIAISMVQSKGVDAIAYSGNQKVQARARGSRQVEINRASRGWQNPAKTAMTERGTGFWSSSSPVAVVYHEIGHIRDKAAARRSTRFGESWALSTRETDSNKQFERGMNISRLARRVSRYATYSPSEFIAETYAGLRTGRKYDHQVMAAYRETLGLPRASIRRIIRRKAS